MTFNLTHEELRGLIEAVDRGLDDRQNYLSDGNPNKDYDAEWPEIARDQAERWRQCASALDKLGKGEYRTLEISCRDMAESLEASAREFRNPDGIGGPIAASAQPGVSGA